MKRFLTTILALLLLATCAWSADTIQVMQGGKILPQYLGINATDSLNWNSTTGVLKYSSESGRLRAVTYYTANATYTKPEWLKFVEVEGVAGGGAGGGVNATIAGQNAIAGGGQAGGYGAKRILAAAIGATEAVTIGVGGAAAAAGSNAGNAGTATSFGAHLTLTGGAGGNGGNPFTSTASSATAGGTSGGQAVGGDLNIPGEPGGRASVISGYIATTGIGAASPLSASTAYVSNGNGADGSDYGGGGSGPYIGTNQEAKAGGAGGDGLLIVREYE